MSKTIYVVNWPVDSVGGFEWFHTFTAAHRWAGLTGPDCVTHEVTLPDEVGDDPEGITSWLDSEGWSDGGDPRKPVRKLREPKTANGVPLRSGLRVWNNDLRRVTVDLTDALEESGELWFVTKNDAGQFAGLSSESRVSTRHPRTNEEA